MHKDRFAILDLGTNTFHLLIIEVDAGEFVHIYKEKLSVKIGEGGINRRHITAEAEERALKALHYFNGIMAAYNVKQVAAVATSAFRNANNGKDVAERIKTETGISVRIIDGDLEAEYIYHGVRLAVDLGEEPVLIMDIGGGSVEFIIGHKEKVFWKRSFEIGGQRLLELFHQTDPIPNDSVGALYEYIEEQLTELAEAVEKHKPVLLVGSSGSFDTLAEIHFRKLDSLFDIETHKRSHVPLDAFAEIFADLLIKDRSQRLEVPGMIELRADMIVVACCIIDHVLQRFALKKILVSTYSLKEGYVSQFIA